MFLHCRYYSLSEIADHFFTCIHTLFFLYCRYYSLSEIADHFFPPRERLGDYDSHFSTVKYWKQPLPEVCEKEILDVDKTENSPDKWQPTPTDKRSASESTDPPQVPSHSDSILPSDNSYDLLDTFSDSDEEEDMKLTRALEPRREFQKTGKYWLMPFSLYM